MLFEIMVVRTLSRATSYLPHIKLPIPYRLAPRRSLKVYLDSELGLPLNFREPKIQEFFTDKLDDYGVIFDIGAHIGTYTILATRSQGVDVHAFEPHPTNVRRLNENVEYNGLIDQIETVSGAITDSNGEIELVVGNSDTTHSVVSDVGESVVVDSTTLDTYCDDHTPYPDLVKVDVEGGGNLVIDGASEILKQHPDWLVETHSEEEKGAFVDAFESNGYTVSRIAENHWFVTVE